jgi:hypothetical protein
MGIKTCILRLQEPPWVARNNMHRLGPRLYDSHCPDLTLLLRSSSPPSRVLVRMQLADRTCNVLIRVARPKPLTTLQPLPNPLTIYLSLVAT